MFEQDRLMENERSRGVFRGDSGPGMGMSRYQVSGTGDSAEIAADRAADQAVGGGLFRSAEGVGGSGFQADLADSDLGGGGSPLPEGLMGSMEQSLGGSFSGVRRTSSKIFWETCSSRTMSAEIPGSAMLSSSRFISAMASRPSRIILSRASFPVDSSLGLSWVFSPLV